MNKQEQSLIEMQENNKAEIQKQIDFIKDRITDLTKEMNDPKENEELKRLNKDLIKNLKEQEKLLNKRLILIGKPLKKN